MEITQVFNEINSFPDWALDEMLLKLLCNKRIDISKVLTLYVKSLEEENGDKLNKLMEAEQCVIGCLSHGKNSKQGKDNIQRSLYLLNKSNRYQMQTLNEKLHYNEEAGKSLSWYEMNKSRELEA